MESYIEKERKDLALKIWNIPFAAVNLHKLKKSELVLLLNDVLSHLEWNSDNDSDVDYKDFLFERKCFLIESLDPFFFKSSISK